MPAPRETRTAASLLHATGTASAEVIAARLSAFATPAPWSAWHRREALRMGSEKWQATNAGLLAAGLEMSLLPLRMLQIATQPRAWGPAAWIDVATQTAALWTGVGNAALRPAKNAAVRNRARLARSTPR